MTNVQIKDDDECPYTHDVERIVNVLAYFGYLATPKQAETLWKKFSDSMAAGWMNMPDDDSEIYHSIRPYISN